jgi:hypothetical protein
MLTTNFYWCGKIKPSIFESHLIRKSKESMPSDKEYNQRFKELRARGGTKRLF